MKTIPTWGYTAGDARIFDLKEGESLPDGWVDSPAKAAAVETASAVPAAVPEELPADWRTLHHFKRIRLAKAFAPELAELIASAKEADAILAEVEAGNG